MITACELCAKITVENALREEATRIAKMKTAKVFAEEILSPILSQLTEVPDHFLIGYRYEGGVCGLFKRISGWSKSTTSRGNLKKERNLTDAVGGGFDFSKLDYEVLNQYLAEFGFQISVETKWICMTEYSSSTRDTGLDVEFLYISMTCPMEDF
jgi:hypothetical protein